MIGNDHAGPGKSRIVSSVYVFMESRHEVDQTQITGTDSRMKQIPASGSGKRNNTQDGAEHGDDKRADDKIRICISRAQYADPGHWPQSPGCSIRYQQSKEIRFNELRHNEHAHNTNDRYRSNRS